MFLLLVANLKQGVIYFIKQACANDILASVYTPPRTARISGLKSWNDHFWLKSGGEKWSRKNYFEIPRAPSELLLPSAEKSAQKGWIGLAEWIGLAG